VPALEQTARTSVGKQLAAEPLSDLAVHHHVAAGAQARMVGILLDQEDRDPCVLLMSRMT
jgi:hypothetical protein